MKKTKNEKIETSKALAEALKKAPHLFFTEFQGLKFVELDELRAKLRPLKCRYAVIKNSTVRYALKNAGIDGIDPKLLKGPVGMVVADTDDPVSPAKVLAAVSKQFPLLKVKAGLINAKWMTPGDCQKLATIGSRPELLGKLAGALYQAVAQGPSVMAAPIRDFVLILRALEDKKSKESGAAAAV